jgi:hypothetical protein
MPAAPVSYALTPSPAPDAALSFAHAVRVLNTPC